MKPAAFAYARPRSLPEALDLLSSADGIARIIAGGQSLGPMLNLRLLQPDLVVDIGAIPELRCASVQDGHLVLGACVTHADIEDGRVPDTTGGALARVASAIAYRAVRNRGTVGGSLAHADPAADWLTALLCLDASVELASKTGRRRLPLRDFVRGALDVALQPGELLAAVHVAVLAPDAGWGYVKHCRKAGESAHAIGAVLIDARTGTGRAVIGAIDAPPAVIDDVSALFGGRTGPGFAGGFDRLVADAALRSAGLSDDIDRHVHVTVLHRAALAADRGGIGAAEAA